jgi:hypothetical protein
MAWRLPSGDVRHPWHWSDVEVCTVKIGTCSTLNRVHLANRFVPLIQVAMRTLQLPRSMCVRIAKDGWRWSGAFQMLVGIPFFASKMLPV